ncbi:MAG: hypothetical protein KJ981_11470 [Alphaproteobacteria bacterium]|uniref:hypothetical protein n=1 Tax=Rhizobium sp. AAP116 TaxID=1523429 RepID=UPI0006B9B7F6|nr:hypothetical protein [Rhizobium sp. AAP116]MBU0739353.1 hypothetical protein [Alphaproteobacteria bacterium]MDM7979748.1 hypothetical protein [Rhizobium sp.]KPF60710.1 hypothetical protein IP85_04720 [Rhizobium sp. AAP116]MBU0833022.1 hypothetical protein [Alphaproteobacteria bacterium]MBU1764508.1 hypothetical protein [Alphaproteobacteria bacterium]
MKTILAASVIALMATSAMARGWGSPPPPPPVPAPEINMNQVFQGIQAALNKIEGGEDVNDVTQTALNAANLINLPDEELDVVTQTAAGAQLAANYVNFSEDLSDVTQSATNVLNSLTVDSVTGSITQTTTAGQAALNAVEGVGSYGWKHGKGGYGSDDIYDVTQTALNAANLVSLGSVSDDLNIVQTFTTGQLAANYVGALDNVSKITQSATNVANSIGAIASGE